MKKRLVDAEAWLSQCAHSWMYYNTAKHIIERAPSYEVEEELLTPCEGSERATDGRPYEERGKDADALLEEKRTVEDAATVCGANLDVLAVGEGSGPYKEGKKTNVCKCRACGAEITWIKMPSGKSMPCDVGKVRYRADPAGKESFVTERGSIVRGVSAPDGESWGCISHFKTCPKAEEFRRKT